ncbi:MAG: hypothetical protein V4534_05220 [Myxococcota bacterium]
MKLFFALFLLSSFSWAMPKPAGSFSVSDVATLVIDTIRQLMSYHTFGTEFGVNQIAIGDQSDDSFFAALAQARIQSLGTEFGVNQVTVGDQSYQIVPTSGVDNNCFFAALAHAEIEFERPDLVQLLESAINNPMYHQWVVNDMVEADFQGSVEEYISTHIGGPDGEHGFHMFGFGLHDAGILDIIAQSLDLEIQIIYYPENGDAPIIRTTLGGANPAPRKITLMLRGRHFQYLRPLSSGITQDNPTFMERQSSPNPGRKVLSSFGNEKGHKTFKAVREKVIEFALESERSFDDVMSSFAKARQQVAVLTESTDATQFGEPKNATTQSYSPVMRYPIMRHRFGDLLARLNRSPKGVWITINGNLVYRIREIDVSKPAQQNQFSMDLFETGSQELFLSAFGVFLEKDGAIIMKPSDADADGNMAFTHRHLRYQDAFKQSSEGKTNAYRVLYLETRIRRNKNSPWLFGRSLISGMDGSTPNFYAESPMFLVHPEGSVIAQFYLPRLRKQFDVIKSKKDTFTELEAREAIGRFMYQSSVSMLTRRGWSAVTEWFAEYFYRLCKVQGRPVGREFAYWDQIAQSCLTEEEFLAIYLGSFPPIH